MTRKKHTKTTSSNTTTNDEYIEEDEVEEEYTEEEVKEYYNSVMYTINKQILKYVKDISVPLCEFISIPDIKEFLQTL
jgi:phosphoribosylaminoimidazole-succinocarboxamide synthase